MIRFTIPALLELGFAKDHIILSLENRMKCGIGKCGRCNVGAKYVCVDGPVFTFAELEKLPAGVLRPRLPGRPGPSGPLYIAFYI